MASSKLGLLLLLLPLLPTQPQRLSTGKGHGSTTGTVEESEPPACPKAPRWVTGLPSLTGRKKVLARTPSPISNLGLG